MSDQYPTDEEIDAADYLNAETKALLKELRSKGHAGAIEWLKFMRAKTTQDLDRERVSKIKAVK